MKAQPTHKTCTRCSKDKPIEEFGIYRRQLKDRVGVYHTAHCKTCDTARRTEWRRNTPGGKRYQERVNKERWGRIKNNPEQLEAHRRYNRQYMKQRAEHGNERAE